MTPLSISVALLSLALSLTPDTKPQTSLGPVIPDYGPVFTVEDVDFATPTDRVYRVVFDVGAAPEDGANPKIETLARFLNMHAQAGIERQKMDLALVLHGAASRAALSQEGYRQRFKRDNPDLELINALSEAGVQIYLCGQTAAYRGFSKKELAKPVKLALSAMTVLVTLQNEGYALIAF